MVMSPAAARVQATHNLNFPFTMKQQSSPSPSTPPNSPTPEYSPPPGDVPKKFPEKQPLSDDSVEGAKKTAASSESEGTAEHAGEDREVESGLDRDDPEHPLHAEGDEAMK